MFSMKSETNGTWIRVDASLGENDTRAVGYPMFFEKEKGWTPPILALAFEDSSIIDVTSTYNSDGFRLLSPLSIAVLIALFILCLVVITKFLIFPANVKKQTSLTKTENL